MLAKKHAWRYDHCLMCCCFISQLGHPCCSTDKWRIEYIHSNNWENLHPTPVLLFFIPVMCHKAVKAAQGKRRVQSCSCNSSPLSVANIRGSSNRSWTPIQSWKASETCVIAVYIFTSILICYMGMWSLLNRVYKFCTHICRAKGQLMISDRHKYSQ